MYRYRRNEDVARNTPVLNVDSESPLMRSHNKVSNNGVDHRALAKFPRGEAAP
jgi:hypothetical protein